MGIFKRPLRSEAGTRLRVLNAENGEGHICTHTQNREANPGMAKCNYEKASATSL